MIKLNGTVVNINHFPDGTLLMKSKGIANPIIQWNFESNEELVALIFLTRHLNSLGVKDITLFMPYIPNARQDRVKTDEDVFTLKYFAEIINNLNFKAVYVLDPHSAVSEALIENISIVTPDELIIQTAEDCKPDILFYPDEGAMKRYSVTIPKEYAFGIKKRDWQSGKIEGLDVCGNIEKIKGKNVLIIDDICSRGGTFYHSAKKLNELGANKIYLYITHCENTIFEGELLKGDLIDKIYTTNSILTKNHEKIEVFEI